MARKVSSSSEYSSSTCTPFTPISEMSSVKTPGSDSMVVHSIALERGAARTARSVDRQAKARSLSKCNESSVCRKSPFSPCRVQPSPIDTVHPSPSIAKLYAAAVVTFQTLSTVALTFLGAAASATARATASVSGSDRLAFKLAAKKYAPASTTTT